MDWWFTARAQLRSKILSLILLALLSIGLILLVSCSGDDDVEDITPSSASASTTEVETSPTLVAATDPVDGLQETAITYLTAYKALNFSAMAPLEDPPQWGNTPPTEDECEDDPYRYLPCSAKEITNIVDGRQPSKCRQPTPAESANGYGHRCAFKFVFAERPVGESTAYTDAALCVIAQQFGSRIVIVETGYVDAEFVRGYDCDGSEV